jgi:transcriptional regulator GlxA family with amidase domain
MEDYIEGNWDQPQSIDALSVIVGVSARSLFQYFQKKRGYSPMVSSC